jgi:hypothetical protein
MENVESNPPTEVVRMSAELVEPELAPLPAQDIPTPIEPPPMEFMAVVPDAVEASASVIEQPVVVCK